jgi:hypothetical protein
MVDSIDRERYVLARARATEAFWRAESLHDDRIAAEHDAADRYVEILRQAGRSHDIVVRRAARDVRARREQLRGAGDVLATSLLEAIERLVGVDADAIGFVHDADALLLLVSEGRATLADRHLAVTRAERVLDDLLVRAAEALTEPRAGGG